VGLSPPTEDGSMKKSVAYRLSYDDLTERGGFTHEEAITKIAKRADVRYSTVDRALRKAKETKVDKIKEEIVGIIGDSHLPYEHKDYLEFCKKIFKENGVNRVIHIGDLLDNHGLSFHDSEPSLLGPTGERNKVIDQLQPWYEAFPKLTLIFGNHDLMANRKALKMGIDPAVYMRPLSEVYNFPKGWDMQQRLILNNVMYHHGETATGVNGFRNDAKARMMNTVTGHNHSNFGVSYTATDHRMVWGLAVGCGVDNESMAFAYGRNFKNKPILGCGVVAKNGKLPMCFPMDLGEKW